MSAAESLTEWRPNPGPQTAFLASRANEVLFGGAAGGGKSFALTLLPTRWIHDRRFSALILRRETTQLVDLWDKAAEVYARAFGDSVRFNTSERRVRFKSGARIWFTHCEYEKDAARFDGHEYQLICFDELTHFTRSMYLRIRARLRGPRDLPKYARATTNPGGEGHDWVFQHWAPWLDPASKVKARPGEKLWFLPGAASEGDTDWSAPDATREIVDPTGKVHSVAAQSRVFIPSLLIDNPHADETYRAELLNLDPVRRAQLLDGNWLVKAARGEMFKRGWFKLVPELPKGLRGVRYWDRAATEVDEEAKSNPDWTVGVRMWTDGGGRYWIDDVVRFRGEPATVENTIRATAVADGVGVAVWLEQDPAQAGKFEIASYVRLLRGFNVKTRRPDRDKVTRASPFSAQVSHGNVSVVAPPGGVRWLGAFLDELEAFPSKGVKDDQVDAAGGAFAALNEPTGPTRGTVWEGHRGV